MRAVSDRFLSALRGSHQMVSRATLLTTFQEGTEPVGTELLVLGGDVRSSAQQDIRATLDLTTDGTGWDHGAEGLLTPYGNEVFIERGIVFGGGIREWVSQGYFRIYDVEQDDAPNGPVRIAGRDRMSGLIDAKLEAPRQFLKTATITSVFDALVLAVYPDATIEFDDALGSTLLGRTVVAEEDRFTFLRDLVRSHSKVMYWNHEGKLQITDPPDPTTAVWDVNAGESGVLVSMGRKLTRDGMFNAVVATGEAADTAAPARGVARDVNTASPTYYYGPFGPVPRFYSSPFLTTNLQARNAAKQLLIQSLGRPHAVDFTSIPNPALEPLDPVSLKPGTGTETHVIDDIALSLLSTGPLGCTTRNQLGIEIEAA